MKTLVALAAFLAIAPSQVLASQASGTESSTWLFTSPDGGFRFHYPKSLVRCEGEDYAEDGKAYFPMCENSEKSQRMIVGFAYPARKYRGYNFQAATVSVSLLSAFNTKGNCFSVLELVNSKVHTVIENEVVFRASQDGETGLGNDKDQHIYRTFHNRSCYEIQISIALSQFANFDPGTIKEFKPSDQQEMYGSLNRVIYTLRFLK